MEYISSFIQYFHLLYKLLMQWQITQMLIEFCLYWMYLLVPIQNYHKVANRNSNINCHLTFGNISCRISLAVQLILPDIISAIGYFSQFGRNIFECRILYIHIPFGWQEWNTCYPDTNSRIPQQAIPKIIRISQTCVLKGSVNYTSLI